MGLADGYLMWVMKSLKIKSMTLSCGLNADLYVSIGDERES